MNDHPEQWKKIDAAFKKGKLPQAMLFVGHFIVALIKFTIKVAQLLFCSTHAPCFTCPQCLLVEGFRVCRYGMDKAMKKMVAPSK